MACELHCGVRRDAAADWNVQLWLQREPCGHGAWNFLVCGRQGGAFGRLAQYCVYYR